MPSQTIPEFFFSENVSKVPFEICTGVTLEIFWGFHQKFHSNFQFLQKFHQEFLQKSHNFCHNIFLGFFLRFLQELPAEFVQELLPKFTQEFLPRFLQKFLPGFHQVFHLIIQEFPGIPSYILSGISPMIHTRILSGTPPEIFLDNICRKSFKNFPRDFFFFKNLSWDSLMNSFAIGIPPGILSDISRNFSWIHFRNFAYGSPQDS